jgi:hypothetical protein
MKKGDKRTTTFTGTGQYITEDSTGKLPNLTG